MNSSESLRRTPFSSIQPVQGTPSPFEGLTERYLPRPVLIHTYLYGRKVKIFQDPNGPFIYTPGYFEHWSFSGIEHPSILLFTEIVELKPPSSYAYLTAKINQQALEDEDRNKTSKLWQQVGLLNVSMLWDLPTGEKGYTVLDEGNCGKVLGTAANRGWRDMLVAMYVEFSTEA